MIVEVVGDEKFYIESYLQLKGNHSARTVYEPDINNHLQELPIIGSMRSEIIGELIPFNEVDKVEGKAFYKGVDITVDYDEVMLSYSSMVSSMVNIKNLEFYDKEKEWDFLLKTLRN